MIFYCLPRVVRLIFLKIMNLTGDLQAQPINSIFNFVFLKSKVTFKG